jgi:hypothetical protein
MTIESKRRNLTYYITSPLHEFIVPVGSGTRPFIIHSDGWTLVVLFFCISLTSTMNSDDLDLEFIAAAAPRYHEVLSLRQY